MAKITPNMSLLQIVKLKSEEVFHQYDDEAGCCLFMQQPV
jgi:hypothetical protein